MTDLRVDPGEEKNIYKEYSARAEELRLALEKLAREEKAAAAPDMQKLDPDTLQRLAALGYVGTTVEVDPEAVLPDSKDKRYLYTLMNAAKGDAQEERLDTAIEKMRSVLTEDPGIIDGHLALRYQLATLLLDIGRSGDADKEFRVCTERNPEMGAAWNSLGAVAFPRGEVEEAARLVAKGLELEPRVRFGAYDEGRILEARGDRVRALAAYRRELEVYPDHGRARFNLAQLLREGGDRAGYLAELRAGTEKSPDFGPCFFLPAREELRAGRLDEAFSRGGPRPLRARRRSQSAGQGARGAGRGAEGAGARGPPRVVVRHRTRGRESLAAAGNGEPRASLQHNRSLY